MKTIKIKQELKTIDSIKLIEYLLAKLGTTSHLKLQKLLYYIEAWHLVFFEQSIIDDNFEAWVHGPVSTKVWHRLKNHSKLYDGLYLKEHLIDSTIQEVESYLAKDQIEFISDLLKEYGNKTSYYLENLVHSELPWLEARKGYKTDDKCTEVISKKIMKDYYQSKIA